MQRGFGLVVLGLVFLLGVAVGYGLGFGVWAVTPDQVSRLPQQAQHLTERVLGVQPRPVAPSRPVG